jgi:hypothetical protein
LLGDPSDRTPPGPKLALQLTHHRHGPFLHLNRVLLLTSRSRTWTQRGPHPASRRLPLRRQCHRTGHGRTVRAALHRQPRTAALGSRTP